MLPISCSSENSSFPGDFSSSGFTFPGGVWFNVMFGFLLFGIVKHMIKLHVPEVSLFDFNMFNG